MRKQQYYHLKQQSKINVIATTQPAGRSPHWLMTIAIAGATIAYLFGFFFSFSGGRVPAGS
jgi:hypothetical protein